MRRYQLRECGRVVAEADDWLAIIDAKRHHPDGVIIDRRFPGRRRVA